MGEIPGGSSRALPPVPPSKPTKPDMAEVLIVLSFVNAAFIWSRILSWRGFWAVLAMVNMIVANALLRKGSRPSKTHKKGLSEVAGEEVVEVPKLPSKLPPIGELHAGGLRKVHRSLLLLPCPISNDVTLVAFV